MGTRKLLSVQQWFWLALVGLTLIGYYIGYQRGVASETARLQRQQQIQQLVQEALTYDVEQSGYGRPTYSQLEQMLANCERLLSTNTPESQEAGQNALRGLFTIALRSPSEVRSIVGSAKLMAERLASLGNHEASLRAYREIYPVLLAQPDATSQITTVVSEQMRVSGKEATQQLIREFVQNAQNNINVLKTWGYVQIEIGDKQGAYDTFWRMYASAADAATYIEVAQAFNQLERQHDARQAMRKAKQAAEDDSRLLLRIAQMWADWDEKREAEEILRSLTTPTQEDAEILLGAAQLYQKLGKDTEAAEAVRLATAKARGNIPILLSIAHLQKSLNNDTGAVEVLRLAITSAQGNASELFNIGEVAKQLGLGELTKEALSAVQTSNISDIYLLTNSARELANAGDQQKAAALLRQASAQQNNFENLRRILDTQRELGFKSDAYATAQRMAALLRTRGYYDSGQLYVFKEIGHPQLVRDLVRRDAQRAGRNVNALRQAATQQIAFGFRGDALQTLRIARRYAYEWEDLLSIAETFYYEFGSREDAIWALAKLQGYPSYMDGVHQRIRNLVRHLGFESLVKLQMEYQAQE